MDPALVSQKRFTVITNKPKTPAQSFPATILISFVEALIPLSIIKKKMPKSYAKGGR